MPIGSSLNSWQMVLMLSIGSILMYFCAWLKWREVSSHSDNSQNSKNNYNKFQRLKIHCERNKSSLDDSAHVSKPLQLLSAFTSHSWQKWLFDYQSFSFCHTVRFAALQSLIATTMASCCRAYEKHMWKSRNTWAWLHELLYRFQGKMKGRKTNLVTSLCTWAFQMNAKQKVVWEKTSHYWQY